MIIYDYFDAFKNCEYIHLGYNNIIYICKYDNYVSTK